MAIPATIPSTANDELGRPRLDWPDPLILDVIRTAYGPTDDTGGAMDAVRLHARFLRALIDGETVRSGPLRVELIACCAARSITPEAVAAADHAAFRELSAIIQSRFRNSPRLRLHFVERLHGALGRLTDRVAPAPAADTPRRLRFPYPSRQPREALVLAG